LTDKQELTFDLSVRWDEKNKLLEVLGSAREQDFDELAELAANVCSAPMGIVSIIDPDKIYLKGVSGLDISEIPMQHSLCVHTITQDNVLFVPDATRDPRFSQSPFVTGEPNLRAYAGVPLHSPVGDKIGALCIFDTIPRELKRREAHALQLVARQVNAQIELRARRWEAQMAANALRHTGSLFHTLAETIPVPCYIKDREGRLLFYNHAFAERHHVSAEEWLQKNCDELSSEETAQALNRAAETAFEAHKYVESVVDIVIPTTGEKARWRLCQTPCQGPSGDTVLAVVAIELSPANQKLWIGSQVDIEASAR
jgi:PAS domain S-box-containing protein